MWDDDNNDDLPQIMYIYNIIYVSTLTIAVLEIEKIFQKKNRAREREKENRWKITVRTIKINEYPNAQSYVYCALTIYDMQM